jgi:hypothetical protein
VINLVTEDVAPLRHVHKLVVGAKGRPRQRHIPLLDLCELGDTELAMQVLAGRAAEHGRAMDPRPANARRFASLRNRSRSWRRWRVVIAHTVASTPAAVIAVRAGLSSWPFRP